MNVRFLESLDSDLFLQIKAIERNSFPRFNSEIDENTIIGYDNNEIFGYIQIQKGWQRSRLMACILCNLDRECDRIEGIEENNPNYGGLLDDIYISKIAIRPDFRDSGLGSILLNNSVDFFKQMKDVNPKRSWALVSEDVPAYGFWEKNGYKFKGNIEATHPITDETENQAAFYKMLRY